MSFIIVYQVKILNLILEKTGVLFFFIMADSRPSFKHSYLLQVIICHKESSFMKRLK